MPDALARILPDGTSQASLDGLDRSDLDTLRHLAEQGMGENTLRALRSDIVYIDTWCRAATGRDLPWPSPEGLVLKFVAHHLWDPEHRERDAAHGMPEAVAREMKAAGVLRKDGPHAPATVRRRLSSWAVLSAWRGVDVPMRSEAVRASLALAVRANRSPRRRKSAQAVTGDVMEDVMRFLDAACVEPEAVGVAEGARLAAFRDRALIAVGFAAGGRRRSEIVSITLERIRWQDETRSRARIDLGRSKTRDAQDGQFVVIAGRAAPALSSWIAVSGLLRGAVFRGVDRWGHVSPAALSPQSVNAILKRRLGAAGYDPARFSAHGLRSGFMTEAFRRGLSLPEAMRQSGHASVQQAAAYFNDADVRNRATDLF